MRFTSYLGGRSPYGNRSFELSVTRDSLPEVLPLAPRHVRNLQHRNAFMRRRLGCGIPDFFSVLCVMFGGWAAPQKAQNRGQRFHSSVSQGFQQPSAPMGRRTSVLSTPPTHHVTPCSAGRAYAMVADRINWFWTATWMRARPS
jgi:hypothetical protein